MLVNLNNFTSLVISFHDQIFHSHGWVQFQGKSLLFVLASRTVQWVASGSFPSSSRTSRILATRSFARHHHRSKCVSYNIFHYRPSRTLAHTKKLRFIIQYQCREYAKRMINYSRSAIYFQLTAARCSTFDRSRSFFFVFVHKPI